MEPLWLGLEGHCRPCHCSPRCVIDTGLPADQPSSLSHETVLECFDFDTSGRHL
jgi:hypothetical protein